MDRAENILKDLARRSPIEATLIVWLGFISLVWADVLARGSPVTAAFAFAIFILLYMGYPLFVILFLAGRFHSQLQSRPGRAIASFAILVATGVALNIVGPERFDMLADAANAGSPLATLTYLLVMICLAIGTFYLIISAALALVDAERGSAAGPRQKLGTIFQFFYLPLCVFFIQRRIRRLVAGFENGDPVAAVLPIEKLTVEKDIAGHSCLVLTEHIAWEEFEAYAKEVLHRLDARVFEKANTVDTHLWDVEVETVPLRLVYEDHPNRVMLESSSFPGDMMLKKLQARLTPAA